MWLRESEKNQRNGLPQKSRGCLQKRRTAEQDQMLSSGGSLRHSIGLNSDEVPVRRIVLDQRQQPD